MRKTIAILISLIMAIGTLGILGGCVESKTPGNISSENSNLSEQSDIDSGNEDSEPIESSDDDEFIKSSDEFEQAFPNYSCEIRISDSDSETIIFGYKVHPDGIAFYSDGSGSTNMIYDLKNNKIIILDSASKTAISMTSDLNSFPHPATYFMAWGEYDIGTMQKDGTAKVDGRDAITYSYKLGGSEAKYYIDKEYGFCIGVDIIIDEKLDTRWEICNLAINNVTEADISAPADYEITDYDSEF